jgi:hypothetical protein
VLLNNLHYGIALLPAIEYNALQTFYTATRGQHWKWKSNITRGPIWNFEDSYDPCNTGGKYWQGITCSALSAICAKKTCHVTTIQLRDYNISGWLITINATRLI